MIFLLNSAIKVSVILLATLVAARLLRGRSAALRHCVLAAGMVSAAITPGLSVVIPGWTWNLVIDEPKPIPASPYSPVEESFSPNRPFIPVPFAGKSDQVATVPPAPVEPQPQKIQSQWFSYSLNPAETLVVLWIAGFGVGLAVLLFGYAHLMWITRGSRFLDSEVWTRIAGQVVQAYSLPRTPVLLQNGDLSVLFTWGWRRPRILVPRDASSWPIDRIRAVLCHELAHVRRGDWVVQMTAELMRAVYWFNPLLWVVCRSLRRESEQACDDAALNSGIACSEYAGHLLDVVRSLRQPRRAWSYALSMAGPSTLERRFVAMLNPATNRQTLSRWSVAAILAAFVTVTFPLSVLRGATAPAEPALVLPAFAGARIPAELFQAAVPATEGTATLQGIVRRSPSGEPVAGVELSLEGGPADPKIVEALVRGVANRGIVFTPKRIGTIEEVLQEALDAAGAAGVGPGFPLFQEAVNQFRAASAARFTAVSDRDGRFAIRNVLPGEYGIRPEREGFFADLAGGSQKVTVNLNQTVETTVLLTEGAVLSGRVLDPTGRPVQDAVVDALALSYENGFPVLRPTLTKTTDDQGEFRIFWLVPGQYHLQATIPPSPTSVVFPNTMRTLYPGSISVVGATPINARAGDKLSGLDVQVKSARLAKISGVLNSTIPPEESERMGRLFGGNPGRPTMLLVWRDENIPGVGVGGGANAGVGAGTPVVMNGGSGKFETQGVLPGSYFLFGRIPQDNANGGAGFAFARIPIEVGDEDISGLSVTINRSVNLTGTVTVDGRPPVGVPARVTLLVDDGSIKLGIYRTLSERFTPADANGAFTIIEVPPGPYHVDVAPNLPEKIYVADVRQGARSVFDSGFEVGSKTPDPIQVLLSSGAATVEGTVVDAGAKPVAGATVVLAPPENRRQNRLLFHQAVTDKNGRFTLRNIGPGGYKLFAWQQQLPKSTWFNTGFMSRYEANGRPVTVSQGATVSQQITVIP
jgi:beta-lactamase regulating signal transducer with metallopeptidase domain